ncbi:FkbM family methyltransferase [Limnofasciculus baicalensis]|uniref:FkbM family methyltransferase n=1 Tax=Limnofasciculus baicalensis BBK-W-15 TaxID=2699891 RepID=A0AAE3GSD5_9CYAN|nr:FkbM family methyltransferase [Limnofasciculus baicalensis]MCP2727687.1 FkbM family methyltransferase [Limnofasciculus baicalensis BBK-W-15]
MSLNVLSWLIRAPLFNRRANGAETPSTNWRDRISNRYQILLRACKQQILFWYRTIRKPGVIKSEGIVIPLGEHISNIIRQDLYRGGYESCEMGVLKSRLAADDTVMEIGAGLGFLSCYVAKKNGSDRVFAYEANPNLEKPIRDLYQLNQVKPTLDICLIGKENGKELFYIEKDFWSSSKIQKNPNSQPIEIPVKSFNQEVRRINPSFLIIDIEGGEYELMSYADWHNVQKILIEIHPEQIGYEQAEFVESKLIEAGFQIKQKICFHNWILFLQRTV